MKRVVITGANGFVGKALVQACLAKGIEVYAVVRRAERLQVVEGLHIVELSLGEYDRLPGQIGGEVDVFFHLAWAGYGSHTNDPAVQFQNVLDSIQALEAAIQIGVKRFVFAGSCSEVQKKLVAGVPEPVLCSVYGAAKAAFKRVARTMALDGQIEFCSTLFSHVFGPGDFHQRSANLILQALLQGKCPRLIPGERLYDWTYIADAVQGLLCVAERGHNLKDYYVGSKEPKPFREIVTQVRDMIAPQVELEFGSYPDNSFVDYGMLDLQATELDCGFSCAYTLQGSIPETAEWVTKHFLKQNG